MAERYRCTELTTCGCRCSIQSMAWKSTTPGQPDFYVPPRTRCTYSVLIMHRRKDLWGPDGGSSVRPRTPHIFIRQHLIPRSAFVRPRAVHRRARAEVYRPEPVHLPPLQRRAPHLPRPTGAFQRHFLCPITTPLLQSPDAYPHPPSSHTTRYRSCSSASSSAFRPSRFARRPTPSQWRRRGWDGARMRLTDASASGCGVILLRTRR